MDDDRLKRWAMNGHLLGWHMRDYWKKQCLADLDEDLVFIYPIPHDSNPSGGRCNTFLSGQIGASKQSRVCWWLTIASDEEAGEWNCFQRGCYFVSADTCNVLVVPEPRERKYLPLENLHRLRHT